MVRDIDRCFSGVRVDDDTNRSPTSAVVECRVEVIQKIDDDPGRSVYATGDSVDVLQTHHNNTPRSGII